MKKFGSLIALVGAAVSAAQTGAFAQDPSTVQKDYLDLIAKQQAARRTVMRDLVPTQDPDGMRNEYLSIIEKRRRQSLPAYETDGGYVALATLRRGLVRASEVRADRNVERRAILTKHLIAAGVAMYADDMHQLPMVQRLINRGVEIMLELDEKAPVSGPESEMTEVEKGRQATVVNYLGQQYNLILNQGFQLDIQGFDYYRNPCKECTHDHFCDKCRGSDAFRNFHVNLVNLAIDQLAFVTDPGKLVGRKPDQLDKVPGYYYGRADRGDRIVALGDPLVALVVETNATAFAAEDLLASLFCPMASRQKHRLLALSNQLRTSLEAGECADRVIEDAWRELRSCDPAIVPELRKVAEYIRDPKNL